MKESLLRILFDAALGVDAWFEWVPSKANIADLPSRLESTWSDADRAAMAALRARAAYEWRPLESPTAAELADMRTMAARARAVARQMPVGSHDAMN